ncbi:MAG: PilZ domain-containing protein [Leptospiraceae bacterium]|nr:PilZ domain-containing protein [Leptospiraceae bacterium]MCB1317671.1 PilZ domain-containing protein [Leptospiraceae bacterium]
MSEKSLFNHSIQVRDAAHQKRKKARTSITVEGEYALQSRPADMVPCTVTDVGTGGLSFVTRATLYQGDEVMVRFKLGAHPVKLNGSVIRVSGKNVGIQYQGVSEQQLEIIQKFIHTTFFEKDPKKKK